MMAFLDFVIFSVALFAAGLGLYQMTTKPCHRCRARLRKSAVVCTSCGSPQRRRRGTRAT